jgi:site-specific recombinase XerD
LCLECGAEVSVASRSVHKRRSSVSVSVLGVGDRQRFIMIDQTVVGCGRHHASVGRPALCHEHVVSVDGSSTAKIVAAVS